LRHNMYVTEQNEKNQIRDNTFVILNEKTTGFVSYANREDLSHCFIRRHKQVFVSL